MPIDIIEWRADFYLEDIIYNEESKINIIEISKSIKKITNKPIIFTMRSYKEGGKLKSDFYNNIIDIYKTVIKNKCFDLIDLEILTLKERDIVYIINKMIKLKCDIPKVAYMPKNKKDVINLLEAVSEIKDFPIIAISMGKLGIITRIFGSVITFASAKSSSAPGQIEAMKLKYILDNLYN